MTITSQKLRKDAASFQDPENARLLIGWADELDELEADRDRLRLALEHLVNDVQDYEAWQRPCLALDGATVALSKSKELASVI